MYLQIKTRNRFNPKHKIHSFKRNQTLYERMTWKIAKLFNNTTSNQKVSTNFDHNNLNANNLDRKIKRELNSHWNMSVV